MTYAEARREARKLLGPSAELRSITAPVMQHHVGVVGAAGFVLMGAGSTWAVAIDDVRRQLSALGGADGKNGEDEGVDEAGGGDRSGGGGGEDGAAS